MEEDAPVHVREARAEDADLLVDYIIAGARESEERQLERGIVETGIAAALGDPEHRRYYVASRKDRNVGCCMVTTEWSDWMAGWYWWLQSVYIEPDHRGRETGVLDGIVDTVHEAARAEGVIRVYLYVHKDNHRAVRAYENRGYRKTDYLVYEKEP